MLRLFYQMDTGIQQLSLGCNVVQSKRALEKCLGQTKRESIVFMTEIPDQEEEQEQQQQQQQQNLRLGWWMVKKRGDANEICCCEKTD